MGLNETSLGMFPPSFIYQLALQSFHSPRQAHHFLKHGLLTTDPKEAFKLGWVDELISLPFSSSPMEIQKSLNESGIRVLNSLNQTPFWARARVKSLCFESLLKEMKGDKASEALDSVWKSVSGSEFQIHIKQVLNSLKKKRR